MLSSLEKENVELKKELEIYKQENKQLHDNNKLLKKALYGQSSERVEDLPDQYKFFNEAEELSQAPRKTIEVSYNRKAGKKKRKPLPQELKREIVINDLPEADKKCTLHGKDLKEIKTEIKEYLVTKPPEVFVRQVQTKIYSTPCCKKTPPKKLNKKSIIPGSIATEETIAFIIFSKYFQHLPLYRLEDLYKLYGIELKRGVMASWLINISRKLTPLYNILEEKMLSTGYISIDETRIQVLGEKERRPQTKSSMWVRASEELGIALFDYDESKETAAVNRLLKGYTGVLQADEHRCCDVIEEDLSLRLGCMMHARRRFKKALDVSEGKSELARIGLSFFKNLYKLEGFYKDQKLTVQERFRVRKKDQNFLLTEYKMWLLEVKEKVPPKSKLGNAINYSLKYWDHLTNYLSDGRFEIDNGFVERQIKQFALGRKNWLFSSSVEGAESSSILYSILVSMKLNKKDPYETLVEVLKRRPWEEENSEIWEGIADLILK